MNSPGELDGLALCVGLSAMAGVPEGAEGKGLGSLEAILKILSVVELPGKGVIWLEPRCWLSFVNKPRCFEAPSM